MELKQWYALLLREANAFVAPREKELRAVLGRHGHLRDFEAQIEKHVSAYLAATDDLIDLIRFSSLEEKPPSLWRDAQDWDSVLFRTAYACLAHDLAMAVQKVLNGELPRVAPEQVVG